MINLGVRPIIPSPNCTAPLDAEENEPRQFASRIARLVFQFENRSLRLRVPPPTDPSLQTQASVPFVQLYIPNPIRLSCLRRPSENGQLDPARRDGKRTGCGADIWPFGFIDEPDQRLRPFSHASQPMPIFDIAHAEIADAIAYVPEQVGRRARAVPQDCQRRLLDDAQPVQNRRQS